MSVYTRWLKGKDFKSLVQDGESVNEAKKRLWKEEKGPKSVRAQQYGGESTDYNVALRYGRLNRLVDEGLPKFDRTRFIMRKRLGEGSYGEVILGTDTLTNTSVAVKFVPKLNQLMEEEFLVELMALRKLQSLCHQKAVICIRGIYETETRYCIVMDALDKNWITLETWLQRPPLHRTLKHIEVVAHQLIDKLQKIHEAGIAHRDIKPGNIMINELTYEIRFIDFGLSCWDKQCERYWTAGTPLYASPQFKQLDRRYYVAEGRTKHSTPDPFWHLSDFQQNDRYAIGMIIIEMFNGRPDNSKIDIPLEKELKAYDLLLHLPSASNLGYLLQLY